MNQNDLFLSTMIEYGVGEEAASNGWNTLVKCVTSEFTDGVDYQKVQAFLRTQEKLFKDAGNVLPAAYRSAKSTLLNGIKHGVNIEQGKSAVYGAIKGAKVAMTSPKEPIDLCIEAVSLFHRRYCGLSEEERSMVLSHLKGLFPL